MTSDPNQNNLISCPLGQTVLKYQVPLDVFNIINHVYETKYPTLPPANKQLVGKIEKEHSLFYQGKDTSKMHHHNMLTDNVLQWVDKAMGHYLDFNKIKGYKKSLNSIWVIKCFNMNTIQCMFTKEVLYILVYQV